jgi:HAD superfamily hydrolase (TIGR01509 family)
MLRGIVFDLDGVLVDSHPAHKRAWKKFFTSVGRHVSDEELEFVLEGQKREDILRHFLDNLTDEQVKDYGAQKEALFKNSVSEIKFVEGLPAFLARAVATGLTMAIASSASSGRVEYLLRQLGFKERFQAVVTGDDVARGKPDPAIFILAADRMNVRPADILVCEDAVNGVEAAKRAGMKCLAIAANGRGPLLEKAGADKVVSDFSGANLDELRGLFA